MDQLGIRQNLKRQKFDTSSAELAYRIIRWSDRFNWIMCQTCPNLINNIMYRYTSQESAIEVMQVLKNILRQHYLYCTVVY